MKSESKDLEENGDLKEEIQIMRVLSRRLLYAVWECRDVGELSYLLNALGLAAKRVGGLMKTRKFPGGDMDEGYQLLNLVIEEAKKVCGERYSK